MGVPVTTKASRSGTFLIGGEKEINRLGFGAMRITGRGIWGGPADRAEAIRTLEQLPLLGVNFIDTADSYGPHVSEELIRQVLHPYHGMLVATKAGLMRPGPNQWISNGQPEYLRQQAYGSRQRLGVDQIDLWQLHRIDPHRPRHQQFEAVRSLIDDGVVRHVGLSGVSIDDIEAATAYFPVATVQNHYNLMERTSQAVLDYCGVKGIGFIPFFPLGAGGLAKPKIWQRWVIGKTTLDSIAEAHGATKSQIALAWLLRRSSVVLPIPGTSKVQHLAENVGASAIQLSDADLASLDRVGHTHE
jgi:pyridoxine 4-dehydrogenase